MLSVSPTLTSPADLRAEPRFPWREILPLVLAAQALIWTIAGLSQQVVNKGSYFTAPASAADWFTRWDAVYFLEIADPALGYRHEIEGAKTNVVFLPLYPFLIRALSLDGALNLKFTGYVLSLGCLWLACVWLWRAVAREWHDPQLATRSVAFLVFGPVSFFFSCIYSEALFLPLVIGCLDQARRGHWWRAGILGALAGATRFVGIALIVPLLWEYATSLRRPGASPFRPASLLACLLPAAGLAAYCGLMAVQFGDPAMYFRGQEYWGRRFVWFWEFFASQSFTGLAPFYQLWFPLALLVAFGLLIAGVFLRVPLTYTVYGLTLGFIYISARFAEALPRYLSVIFPLYIVVALIATRRPAWEKSLLALSAGTLAFSVVLFVNGYWFT